MCWNWKGQEHIARVCKKKTPTLTSESRSEQDRRKQWVRYVEDDVSRDSDEEFKLFYTQCTSEQQRLFNGIVNHVTGSLEQQIRGDPI